MRWNLVFLGILILGAVPVVLGGDPDGTGSLRLADQSSLKAYAGLVGDWRGTGQVRRGSTRGAWRETAIWSWELSRKTAALDLKIENGKYLQSAKLRPRGKPGEFELEAVLADGMSRRFQGVVGDRGTLTLVADGTVKEGLARITLTPLHETRFLLLLEARSAEGEGYQRLGEVGYTRQGVAFAAGDSYPVCIVTEGRGTIKVEYKGQTYWVCCSGCKALFDEDPEAILAELKERQQSRGK